MISKEIINQSIEYIIQHLEEEITVEGIAEQFHFSKFYFCRSFKSITGESLYSFIKRVKIDQSAIDMKLETDRQIADIGMDYGYSSSNYSSVFKNHHFISPAEFRKTINERNAVNPFFQDKTYQYGTFQEYEQKISMEELPDFEVIYERMIGNYVELKEKWIQFMDKYSEFMMPETKLIERFYQDPTITDLSKCICDLCMTVGKDCRLKNRTVISGGKFAIYRYRGSIADIFPALQGIFSVWLPDSGYEMEKRYGFNIYREIDLSSEFVEMDLCIPIK